jgi:hypothetical protein
MTQPLYHHSQTANTLQQAQHKVKYTSGKKHQALALQLSPNMKPL